MVTDASLEALTPSLANLGPLGRLASAMIGQAVMDAQDPRSEGHVSAREWLADVKNMRGMSLAVCCEAIRISAGWCMTPDEVSSAALEGRIRPDRHVGHFGLRGMPNKRALHTYHEFVE